MARIEQAAPVSDSSHSRRLSSRIHRRPPGWGFAALVALGGVPMVCSALGTPPLGWMGVLLTLILWSLLGIVWLVWLGSYLGTYSYGGEGSPWSWWFLLGPVVAALVVTLVLSPLPATAKFALNRDALTAVVAGLPVGAGHGSEVVAGSYSFTNWERYQDGVVFEDAGGVFGPSGLAYLPSGVPTSTSMGALFGYQEFFLEHIDGPWYSWTAIW